MSALQTLAEVIAAAAKQLLHRRQRLDPIRRLATVFFAQLQRSGARPLGPSTARKIGDLLG